MKHFGIDKGGAVISYENGGYSETVLPFCILKFFKSSSSLADTNNNVYCLLCEKGYYPLQGQCVEGTEYCDEQGIACKIQCKKPLYYDSQQGSCVSDCFVDTWFRDDAIRECVEKCSGSQFG